MAPRDSFSRLPSEITIAILSRLHARAVALSKCVCKAWQDLLGSNYFVDSYHSKSGALAVLGHYADQNKDWCKVFEIEDGVDALESDNPMTKFEPPHRATDIGGSANGLLFLNDHTTDCTSVYNPITREYIKLPLPEEGYPVAFGFGASKASGEHKVVEIVSESGYCHVYTLGTGEWRHVEAASVAIIDVGRSSLFGTFVDGNIYWKVRVSHLSDQHYKALIFCFDLGTERFSTFRPPPVRGGGSNTELFTLKGCLCFSDEEDDDGIGLWLMKECGVDKSWRKEYVIKRPDFGFEIFQPIKVFKDGDILVLCDENMFFRYSIKTKTYQEIQSFGTLSYQEITKTYQEIQSFGTLTDQEIQFFGTLRGKYSYINSLFFTPSFRSLKSLASEDVISY